MADDSDMLIFESPNDTENKKLCGTEMSFYATINNDKQNMQSLVAMYSGEQIGEGCQPENLSFHPREGTEMMENSEKHDMTASYLMNDPMEEMDYENCSGLYRGMRRRCLVFEMAGAHRQRFEDISAPDSSLVLQSGSDTSTNNRQLVPTNTIDESPRCVVPTLGLHLNALGTTPKDYKLVNLEPSASGRLLIVPSPSVDFHPPTTGQESLNNLDVTSLGGDIDTIEDFVPLTEDSCQASGYVANEVGCSVSIKSLFDSTKIVAKEVVRSMDPNAEVGRQMLGPNWCEIQVLVVLEREESLIRPYDLLQ